MRPARWLLYLMICSVKGSSSQRSRRGRPLPQVGGIGMSLRLIVGMIVALAAILAMGPAVAQGYWFEWEPVVDPRQWWLLHGMQ